MEPLSDESNVDAQRGYEPLLQIPSWALNWQTMDESNIHAPFEYWRLDAEPTNLEYDGQRTRVELAYISGFRVHVKPMPVHCWQPLSESN